MKLATLLIVSLCSSVAFATENEKFNYNGYKVYKIIPTSAGEVNHLQQFRNNPLYDFWSQPRGLNVPTTVMVKPEAQTGFESYLTENKVNFSVIIDDVEVTVQKENSRQKSSSTKASRAGEVSFDRFMRMSEINEYLETLAASYPEKAKLLELGSSFNGIPIKGLKISSGGSNKPAVFVDAGIHAREWITSPTALYLVQQLVETDSYADLLARIDWIVVPNINPDGYEFTHTDERLWRKTRSPHTICAGADPNRNFDYYWMLEGASDWQCDETYAGPSAFSESETRAVRDFLHANNGTIKMYVTLHSYGNYLLYPWGYTSDLPSNNDELYALAVEVDRAMSAAGADPYTIGTSTNVLYAAAGGSDDYAKGAAGIELSYTVELPGGGDAGFNPPATSISKIVKETFEGLKVFGRYIDSKFGQN